MKCWNCKNRARLPPTEPRNRDCGELRETCLMKTFDPFPQSSDAGALLQEWNDELPPCGASRRVPRVTRGLGRPMRDAKRARKAGPPGGPATVGGTPMNPIRPMNPTTFAQACDASSQSGSSSASGSSEAPQGTATTDSSCTNTPPPSQRRNRFRTWPSRGSFGLRLYAQLHRHRCWRPKPTGPGPSGERASCRPRPSANPRRAWT